MNFRYPKIVLENEYREIMPTILNELENLAVTEFITADDGCQLYCERYVKPENHGNMVILHGFSEFSTKYKELIWYFLSSGLNVFIYDQRGHGFSQRMTSNIQLIHIDSFDQYILDLETVVEKQVKPYGNNLPMYVFSHSMGGAITTLYMMKHPDRVKKSILCAPMVSPQTRNIPRFLVQLASKYFSLRDGKDAQFPYFGSFDSNVEFDKAFDNSRVRFDSMLALRVKTPEYQASSGTNGWMHKAVLVEKQLLNRKKLAKIKSDVLILSAGNDTVVKNEMQHRLAKMLPECKIFTIEGAKHNIFFSDDKTLEYFYKLIFDFLSKD